MMWVFAAVAFAGEGYLRTPDVHGDTVVFAAEGDLWQASVSGGAARRLTRHAGVERLPRYAPSGDRVAFTAAYDGNTDVFVVSAQGGEPRRITWHPASDEVVGWLGDDTLVFRSNRLEPHGRFELFTVPAAGGEPERLPLGWASWLDVDPVSGKWAFNRISREYRTWKRYRGGTAQDIWVGDPEAADFARATSFDGTDAFPMWLGGRVYFVSDQGGTANLWSMAADGSDRKRHTDHGEWDVRWPSRADDDRIVYMLAGDLYLFDAPSSATRKLDIEIPSDLVRTRVRYPQARSTFTWASISPDGERVLYTTRGEIFSVPVEDGVTLPITRGSGSRESWGHFSPDGRRVVYVTDASGEEAIVIADAWGEGEPTVLVPPSEDGGWHFPPRWSPDGARVAFADHTQALYVVAASGGPPVLVARAEQQEIRHYRWSPDGRWLAFDMTERTNLRSVWVWDSQTGRLDRVTGTTTDDHSPAWDPEGGFLYFVGERHVSPVLGRRDFSYVLTESGRPYAVPLKKGAPSPFKDEAGKPQAEPPEESRRDRKRKQRKRKLGIDDTKAETKPVQIDLDGIVERAVAFPVDHGIYHSVEAAKGRVYFLRQPVRGMNDDRKDTARGAQLWSFDLEEEEATVVLSGVGGYELSGDGETLLVVEPGGAVKVHDGKAEEESIDLSGVVLELDPREEWAQIFHEGWRLMRDFYWDASMGGVDWAAERDKYAALLPRLATRSDLRDLMGELIGELATSHTYVWGGDMVYPRWVATGLLGAEVEREGEAVRITGIYRGDPADEIRSPLDEPGVDVNVGEYILAVNHQPLPADRPFVASLQGHVGKPVLLTVGPTPARGGRGTRQVVIEPLGGGDERQLRYSDWVRRNREYVSEKSGGKFGYVHIPDMGTRGLVNFERWFYPQLDKEGMVVDVRWNGGGFVSQLILERFRRKVVSFDRSRGGGVWTYPSAVLNGPFVVLLNEHAGSDGDIFPASVQAEELAPVIGKRSWGGVIGIRGDKPMTDGGMLTQPEYAFWWPKHGWGIENHGVDPDIEVDNLPQELARGEDAQLDRGLAELERLWEDHPPVKPDFGPAPDRSRGAYSDE